MEGKKSRKFLIKWLLIIIAILLFVGIGVYIFLTHRTYDKVHVLSTVALNVKTEKNMRSFRRGF